MDAFKNMCIQFRTVEYLKEVVLVSVSLQVNLCLIYISALVYVGLYDPPYLPPLCKSTLFRDAKELKSNTVKITIK